MIGLNRLKKFSLLFLISVFVILAYFNICVVPIHAEVTVAEEKGWIQNPANGHYRLTEPSTRLEAETQAVEWGGHLVTINDADENAWLVSTFGSSDNFWIGYSDINTEGNWKWRPV